MKILYEKHLNFYAKKLRRAGNFAEVILWDALKKDQLGYRFLRQRPIGIHIVDFYCHSLALAIEIDGRATHDGRIEQDFRRQKALEALGITVVRFKDSDVRYRLEAVVESIKLEILRLASSPPPLEKEEKSSGSQAGSPPPLEKEE